MSVRPSVCPFVTQVDQSKRKLGLPNPQPRLLEDSSFRIRKILFINSKKSFWARALNKKR